MEMADIMSSAFINHANFQIMIKSTDRRKKALYHLFYMMYKVINKKGYIYVLNEDVPIGYITFMDAYDPHQISMKRVIKTKGLSHFIRFIFALKVHEIFQFLRYMRTYNSYHQKLNHEMTIHLYSTGIKESHRGKGLLSKAFKETVIYFKDAGYQRMILETSDATNIPIYQALGFTLKEQIKLIKSDQLIYFFEFTI